MSKKNLDETMEPTMVEDGAADDAAVAKKQAKADAAKRFAEKKAKEKAERIEFAKKLTDVLQKEGYYDTLPEDCKAWLQKTINPAAAGGSSNNSLFKTIFGDAPKAGDSVTLQEVFNKTLKGKSNVDFYVKKWAEKGIVVKYEADPANLLNSRYVIESL